MAGRGDPEVSIVIITVGREGLYTLLEDIASQEVPFEFEILLIANGPVDASRLDRDIVRIVREPHGRGFSYYRNVGTRESRGRIIVYIDDDETPKDDNWLDMIVGPIRNGDERATTGGAVIPLGQGFLADLVSLLGFPGGGALGWENLWPVDSSGHTDKLCTCNCAVEKALLEDLGGFDESLVYGAEDVYLSEMLLDAGVKTYYIPGAVVLHEARGDLSGFLSWQIRRGRSIYDLQAARRLRGGHLGGRLRRTFIIIKRTFPSRRFIPMIGVLLLEYLCQFLGYALEFFQRRYRSGRQVLSL